MTSNQSGPHGQVWVLPEADTVVLPFNAQIRAQSADAPKENKPAAHHKLNNASILEHMAHVAGQRVYNASFDKMAYFRQFALAPEEEWKVGTVWPACFSPNAHEEDVVFPCLHLNGVWDLLCVAYRAARGRREQFYLSTNHVVHA